MISLTAYIAVLIVLILVTGLVRYFKGGMHLICYVVIGAYVSYIALYNLPIYNEVYIVCDILRLALTAIIMLIASEYSSTKRHYAIYATIIVSQMVINIFTLVGVDFKEYLSDAATLTNLLELLVFINGIHRTIIADNGKGRSGFFSLFTGSSLYRSRYRFNSDGNTLQKGYER